MFFEVTFKNGDVVQVAASNSHTVRIIDATDNVEDSFALNDVTGVVLQQGAIPEPGPAADTVVAEAAPTANDVPATTPVTGPGPDDDHQVAVTAAAAAVETALSADSPATTATVAKQALGDVETALAQWPDSQELLDAKALLEQLSA